MSKAQQRMLPQNGRDRFPCFQDGKSCTKRFPGCHDRCQQFIDAKAANDARKSLENEKRKREYEARGFLVEQSCVLRRKKPAQR